MPGGEPGGGGTAKVMYLRESTGRGVNGGFQIVRDVAAYTAFVQSVLDDPRFDTADYADQSLINERLHLVNFTYLPTTTTVCPAKRFAFL